MGLETGFPGERIIVLPAPFVDLMRETIQKAAGEIASYCSTEEVFAIKKGKHLPSRRVIPWTTPSWFRGWSNGYSILRSKD